MRASAAWRTTGAGSTTLPVASLFATAAVRPHVREIGVFNTGGSTLAIALRRVTAVGTAGTGQAELYEDDESQTPVATCVDTHTVAPTFVTGNLRTATLASLAGVIWTFGGNGLVIPQGTGNGVVIVPLTGTGQICDVSFTWDE